MAATAYLILAGKAQSAADSEAGQTLDSEVAPALDWGEPEDAR